MRVDLNHLEALARAATPGPRHAERFFRAGDKPDGVGRYRIFLLGADNPRTNSRDCDWQFADAHHIAAFDVPTTLALIARIRQLEAALVEALDGWEGTWTSDNNNPPPPTIAELRALVQGTATPRVP